MAEWHLKELRDAIERSGWRFVTEHPGDDYQISATWEFERDASEAKILIAFEGLDDLRTLLISESYGCHLQGASAPALYFRRKGYKNTNRREIWLAELDAFVTALNRAK